MCIFRLSPPKVLCTTHSLYGYIYIYINTLLVQSDVHWCLESKPRDRNVTTGGHWCLGTLVCTFFVRLSVKCCTVHPQLEVQNVPNTARQPANGESFSPSCNAHYSHSGRPYKQIYAESGIYLLGTRPGFTRQKVLWTPTNQPEVRSSAPVPD